MAARRCRAAGFTLIELVMVMAIIMMVLGFAAPSLVGVLKGKKVEQAISSVTGILEQARLDAVTQNTYVWAGFLNVDASNSASGLDELWMMTFRGKSGESRVPVVQTDVVPTAILQRIEGVNMVESGALPDAVKTLLPASFKDLSTVDPSTTGFTWTGSGAGSSAKGTGVFKRLILFTPRGEALLETGVAQSLPMPDPAFILGLARTQGGKVTPNDKDLAAVVVTGVTGRVSVLRP